MGLGKIKRGEFPNTLLLFIDWVGYKGLAVVLRGKVSLLSPIYILLHPTTLCMREHTDVFFPDHKYKKNKT